MCQIQGVYGTVCANPCRGCVKSSNVLHVSCCLADFGSKYSKYNIIILMIFSCLRFKEQHLCSPVQSPASEGSRQVRDMVNQAVEQILVARKSQVMSRASMSLRRCHGMSRCGCASS